MNICAGKNLEKKPKTWKFIRNQETEKQKKVVDFQKNAGCTKSLSIQGGYIKSLLCSKKIQGYKNIPNKLKRHKINI